MAVSIKDIAREIGVSETTVSMALRDHPRISVERRRQRAIAKRPLDILKDLPLLAFCRLILRQDQYKNEMDRTSVQGRKRNSGGADTESHDRFMDLGRKTMWKGNAVTDSGGSDLLAQDEKFQDLLFFHPLQPPGRQ